MAPLPLETHADGPFAGIGVLRLEQPGRPVVVLELELIQRLEAVLHALPTGLRGLVLASASERVFVAGADLKTISESSDDQLHRYLEYGARVFALLGQLPCPTAAAINGAALGGGLELAMHCDALIGAPPRPTQDGQPGKPYPVGLPEASLALCPGWGGTNLLPARMEPAEAIRRTASGQTFLFDEARSAGLFDVVAPNAEQLIPVAKQWLLQAAARRPERDGAPSRWIGRPAHASRVVPAFDQIRPDLERTASGASVAAAIEAGLTQGWEAALNVERRELVRLRHTPEARRALEAFFAKAKK